MSIAERMPTSTRGRWATLTGAALLWAAAYWMNERLWDRVFYDLFGMAPDARLTETLHFFFYDTVKIALLLTGIIFVITILRSYMSIERTRAMLGGRREGRQRHGRRPWRDHPVLLLQRCTGVHRLRRGRSPARGDDELSDCQPTGQRDRDRPAAGPVRVQATASTSALAGDRRCRRLGARSAPPRGATSSGSCPTSWPGRSSTPPRG